MTDQLSYFRAGHPVFLPPPPLPQFGTVWIMQRDFPYTVRPWAPLTPPPRGWTVISPQHAAMMGAPVTGLPRQEPPPWTQLIGGTTSTPQLILAHYPPEPTEPALPVRRPAPVAGEPVAGRRPREPRKPRSPRAPRPPREPRAPRPSTGTRSSRGPRAPRQQRAPRTPRPPRPARPPRKKRQPGTKRGGEPCYCWTQNKPGYLWNQGQQACEINGQKPVSLGDGGFWRPVPPGDPCISSECGQGLGKEIISTVHSLVSCGLYLPTNADLAAKRDEYHRKCADEKWEQDIRSRQSSLDRKPRLGRQPLPPLKQPGALVASPTTGTVGRASCPCGPVGWCWVAGRDCRSDPY